MKDCNEKRQPPFGDKRLELLFEYWQDKKGDQDLPRRRDIDPVEMGADVLPHVMLTEVLESGSRFRYRLAGTTVESVAGQSLSGAYIDELLVPPYLEYILGLYHQVIEERVAIYTESLYPATGSQPERYTKRLMMPLRSADDEVVMVLSGQVFESASEFRPPRSFTNTPSAFKETVRLVL